MLIFIGVYISKEQQFLDGGIKNEMTQMIQDYTEKSIFPGGFCQEQTEDTSLYLIEKALKILPIGNQMF